MIYLPRKGDAQHHRDLIRQLLHQLDDRTISTLIDRARHPETDAWPAGTSEGGSNDVSNPTLAAVIRDAGGRTQADGTETRDLWLQREDTIREAITELFANLAEAAGLAKLIDQRRQFIINTDVSVRGRVNTVELCVECGQPAPLVTRIDGQPYCRNTCYQRVNRQRRNTA